VYYSKGLSPARLLSAANCSEWGIIDTTTNRAFPVSHYFPQTISARANPHSADKEGLN
jgi:hypothetical protein